MIRALLHLLARRGDVHDRPLPPLRVAELEEAAGINPGAVRRVWEDAGGEIPDHCDPDLIDCGRAWCRRRRWN